MAEGDVKQIPKSWDIYQPLSNIDIFSIGINDVMVIISIGIHHIYYTNHFHMVFSSQDFEMIMSIVMVFDHYLCLFQ